MKRGMKSLLCLVLALVMVCGLACTTFAATDAQKAKGVVTLVNSSYSNSTLAQTKKSACNSSVSADVTHKVKLQRNSIGYIPYLITDLHLTGVWSGGSGVKWTATSSNGNVKVVKRSDAANKFNININETAAWNLANGKTVSAKITVKGTGKVNGTSYTKTFVYNVKFCRGN